MGGDAREGTGEWQQREELQEVVRVCRVQSSSVAADSGGSTYRMREMCRCSNGCTNMAGETSEWHGVIECVAEPIAELEQLQLHYVNCTLQVRRMKAQAVGMELVCWVAQLLVWMCEEGGVPVEVVGLLLANETRSRADGVSHILG